MALTDGYIVHAGGVTMTIGWTSSVAPTAEILGIRWLLLRRVVEVDPATGRIVWQ